MAASQGVAGSYESGLRCQSFLNSDVPETVNPLNLIRLVPA